MILKKQAVKQPVEHLPTYDALNIEESPQFKKLVEVHKVRGKKEPINSRINNFGDLHGFDGREVTLKALWESHYLPHMKIDDRVPKVPKNTKLNDLFKEKEERKRAFLPPGIASF